MGIFPIYSVFASVAWSCIEIKVHMHDMIKNASFRLNFYTSIIESRRPDDFLILAIYEQEYINPCVPYAVHGLSPDKYSTRNAAP